MRQLLRDHSDFDKRVSKAVDSAHQACAISLVGCRGWISLWDGMAGCEEGTLLGSIHGGEEDGR